jgi:pSer/pThr/pTyr-binding forkhead associated (FHA) protein
MEDDNALDPLTRLRAADSGETYQLRRRLTRIGRNAENDIIIESDRVSRFHAEIARTDKGLFVTDLKSRNGVYVNEEKITMPRRLEAGDTLRIGRKEFTLEIIEPTYEQPFEIARDADSITRAY